MSNPPLIPPAQFKDDLNDVLGIALFNSAGLPLQGFSTQEHPSRTWMQVAFQSLGMYAMLHKQMGMLPAAIAHPNPMQIICSQAQAPTIVLLSHRQGYVAFLVAITHNSDLDTFCAWVNDLHIERLIQHPKFLEF